MPAHFKSRCISFYTSKEKRCEVKCSFLTRAGVLHNVAEWLAYACRTVRCALVPREHVPAIQNPVSTRRESEPELSRI